VRSSASNWVNRDPSLKLAGPPPVRSALISCAQPIGGWNLRVLQPLHRNLTYADARLAKLPSTRWAVTSSRDYLGGSEVPKLGRALSHGFPSSSVICALQTRLTTNGHLAMYLAARGQRRASQSRFPEMGSNSGPRLLFSIEAPTVSAMPTRTDIFATLDSPSSTPCE
jgi:hypothetical protein